MHSFKNQVRAQASWTTNMRWKITKERSKQHLHSQPGQNLNPLLMNLKNMILNLLWEGARVFNWRSPQKLFSSQNKNFLLHIFDICYRTKKHNLISNLRNGLNHNMSNHNKTLLDCALPPKENKNSQKED